MSMIPNDALSKTLFVEPLKDNETAVFKMLNVHKAEGGREETTRPEVYAFSDRKNVIDPFTGPKSNNPSTITIGNVVGQQPKKDPSTGKIFYDQVTKSVQFIRGFLTLTSSENPTYQYVMRRPENESNKYRSKMAMNKREKTPLFVLENDKNVIKSQLLLEDIKYAAQKTIREIVNATELKQIAAVLNQSPDKRLHIRSYVPGAFEDVAQIKLELLQLVPLFSRQILFASGKPEAKVKIQVIDGISAGFIIYNEGSYMLLGSEAVELYKVKPDEMRDKTDAFVEYLMSEEVGAREKYLQMANVLKKELKVDLTK